MVKAKDVLKGGRGDNKPDSSFNRNELTLGIKHEKEHSPNRQISKETAKDHLVEDPHYYSKMQMLEKQKFFKHASAFKTIGSHLAAGFAVGTPVYAYEKYKQSRIPQADNKITTPASAQKKPKIKTASSKKEKAVKLLLGVTGSTGLYKQIKKKESNPRVKTASYYEADSLIRHPLY